MQVQVQKRKRGRPKKAVKKMNSEWIASIEETRRSINQSQPIIVKLKLGKREDYILPCPDAMFGNVASFAQANPVPSMVVENFCSGDKYEVKEVETNHDLPSYGVKCWHCCHSFTNQRIGIPISDNNMYGIFCSFSCAASYNKHDSISFAKKTEREGLIRMLMQKECGDIELHYAPKKEMLKTFGGTLTIDEYRNTNNSFNFNVMPYKSIVTNIEKTTCFDIDKEIKMRQKKRKEKKRRSVF